MSLGYFHIQVIFESGSVPSICANNRIESGQDGEILYTSSTEVSVTEENTKTYFSWCVDLNDDSLVYL